MKLLKKTCIAFFLILLTLNLASCSGCDNENPRARVTNLGTDVVSVQIKTTGGNTENINNIDPDSSSPYVSYSPGAITYTIVLKDNTELVEIVDLAFCTDYQITVENDNTITTSATKRE